MRNDINKAAAPQALNMEELANISGGYTPHPDDPNPVPWPFPIPFPRPWPFLQFDSVLTKIQPQLQLGNIRNVGYRR